MAFTDDAIRAKLSSLNESQDSIATVSQWIMFYRKHADRTAQVWMQRIKDCPSNKKLSLIYLANEIVQQSKIRKKDEFVKAYDPIIAEATAAAYKGSSSDAQGKIRRVLEVWRQRQVFRPEIQAQIEAALDEVDRTRSSRKPALGGSLISSSAVPPELTPVAPLATALQKAELGAKPAVTTATQDYEKLTNPNNPIPTPPVHAAHLSALVKKLATAEGAVAESIKARRALIAGLEKLLDANKAKLSADEAHVTDLGARKNAIEGRRREVEEAILKGLDPADQHAISSAPLPAAGGAEVQRPDIEELTPPPMEGFTPEGSPQPFVPDDILPEPLPNATVPVAVDPPAGHSALNTAPATKIGTMDPVPNITVSTKVTEAAPSAEGAELTLERSAKKRKMSRSLAEDEMAAFEGDGEIAGMDERLGSLI